MKNTIQTIIRHIRFDTGDPRHDEGYEALTSAILDSIPHAVFGFKERRIIFVNDAVSAVFGWDPQEVMGEDSRILYRTDDEYEAIASAFYEALKKQRTFAMDFPCRRKDGTDIVCSVSAARMGERLKERTIVVTYEDITARRSAEEELRKAHDELDKRVTERTCELQRINETLQHEIGERRKIEASLRESEERFFTLVEFLPDPTFAVDKEQRVIAWNKAMVELTGLPKEDIIGLGDHSYSRAFYGYPRPMLVDLVFFPENDRRFLYERFDKTGNAVFAESNVILANGGNNVYLWGKAAPLFDRSGNLTGVVESLRDITERKRMETDLRKSEEKYRELVQSANSIIMRRNIQGEITFLNQFGKKFFGYAEDEIIGRNVIGSIVPERDSAGNNLAALIADISGSPERYATNENENRCRDGNRVWVSWTNRSIRNSEGTIVEILSIGNDITARKSLEEQLRRAQKMEAVGTLAGGVAHDFNNLLMGIMGYAAIMLFGIDPDHPHYEKLKSIEAQVKSGANLTRQLLNFARGGIYRIVPTDLNELIERTAVMFERTKKEIQVTRQYQKDLWPVDADRGQIEQVVLNLLINAWQAMPNGGNLCLETKNIFLDETYVRPFSVSSGKYVGISVTDNGIGMDEKTRERIFEPFFTTKERGRGTGLGLASAYGIVKGHKGIINVYSEKGHGTTFNVSLPASENIVIENIRISEDLLKGDETVLVVDDEPTNLDVTREMLETLGYQILVAESGRDAIEIYTARKDTIDLLILDMIMPGMGGEETFHRLREINPDAAIIISSGYSMNDSIARLLERGGKAFIQKPFTAESLSQKIRDVLDEG